MESRAAWIALAYRSGLSDVEKRIRAESGDMPNLFEMKDLSDLRELEELGIRLLTLEDDDFPERLRREDGPLIVQIAGRADLIDQEGVRFVPGSGAKGKQAIAEALDAGDRMVVVLSKGMLKARTLLRALAEPIEEGMVTLLSAEPPRAAWGPVRDANRDLLLAKLSS